MLGISTKRLCGQWYSTLFVRMSPDVISLQLCTPKFVGIQYSVYNLHLKKLNKVYPK
jgi:hypothetical protein